MKEEGVRIRFAGACGEVTGSVHLLEIYRDKILLEAGMRQGNALERLPPVSLFDPKEVDFIILSHAHLDHSGLIPYLCSLGFEGTILSTIPTRELSRILLLDSAKIQKEDYELGGPPPLYTEEDVYDALELFKVTDYNNSLYFENFKLCFLDAGHILGSAITILEVNGIGRFCYSGDIGHGKSNILNPPASIEEVDFLILESTYGAKLHPNIDAKSQLLSLIKLVYEQGGRLLIPVFAVGRAQELLFHIKQLFLEEKMPNLKVYLDSPMATKSTELYSEHSSYLKPAFYEENFKRGISPFEFESLEYISSHKRSIELASSTEPAIILAASGMLEGGRVLNHLPGIVESENSAICFAGYQAKGTRGRELLDEASEIKIIDKTYKAKCNLHQISAFSAHADQTGLINFVKSLKFHPKKIYLVHGEKEGLVALSTKLNEMKIRNLAPATGHIEEFAGVRVEKAVEKDFTLDFKPEYIDIGIANLRFAPFVGALVREGGVTKLIGREQFFDLMQSYEKELLTRIPKIEREQVIAETKLSFEEVNKTLEDYFKKGILAKKRAREFREKLLSEGKNSLISYINFKLLPKHRLYPGDSDIEREYGEFLIDALSSLKSEEIIAILEKILETA